METLSIIIVALMGVVFVGAVALIIYCNIHNRKEKRRLQRRHESYFR